MKKKLAFLFFIIVFLPISQVFGENFFISSVLPNTTDDTTQEYIELTNYSSSQIYLSGYSLKDKSGKIFNFTNQTINSQESKKFYRPETMILLNNTDEELFLYDNNSLQIDYFTYTTSNKNEVIFTGHSGSSKTSTGVENIPNQFVIPHFILTGSISNISYSGANLTGLSFTGVEYANISWGTGILDNTGIITSSSFSFSGLTEETNYYYKLELLSQTGVVFDTSTGSFSTTGLPIMATDLYYNDTDNNDKIDLLEIKFNKNIKGALDYEKIRIYSNSGGLANRTINSETGIINSYVIENEYLKLKLNEQDNTKTDLIISNTTSSDLRLKSLDGLGITSLGGTSISNLSLTSSFNNYRNVFKRETVFTGSLGSSSGSTSSSGTTDSTGGIINSTGTLLEIPDIVITFQQPSYVIESETASGEYFCDKTKSECKVNFSLLNSFSGSFSETDYRCEIYFGTGNIVNTCNPDAFTFPYSTYNLSFKIIDKNNSGNFKEKSIKLYNIYEALEIPNPIIKIQSGLNSSNFCTKAVCSINPTASDSFLTLENSKYACTWNFAGGTYNEEDLQKCNPSYVHYPYGDYTIKLRIYEMGNTNNFKETSFSFRNDIIENYGGGNYSNSEIKKISAVITLQGTIGGKSKKQSGNKLTCIGVETCSVNFTGEHSYSMNSNKIYFEWNFGNGQHSILKNPASVVYGTGIYDIKLRVTDSLGNQDNAEFIVEVTNSGALDNILEIKTMKYKTQKMKEFTTNFEDFLLSNIVKKKIKIQPIVADNSDFDNIFKGLLLETSNELTFENTFDKLLENTFEEVDTISNYSIKLQGKLGKNLSLDDDIIVCKGRKNCKINLALDGQKLTGYTYVWKYPNGEEFVGTNPKTVTFNFGQYVVGLDIFDKNGALILSQNIRILAEKIPTKNTSSSKKIKTNTKLNQFSFVLKGNSGIIQEFYKKISEPKLILIFLTAFIMIIGSAQLINKNSAIFSQL